MHNKLMSERRELTEQEKLYIAKAKQLYTDCVEQIKEDQNNGRLSQATFDLTEKVLRINPELATVWNFRKEYIYNEQDEKVLDQLLSNELSLTESLFKNDPKSYNLWSNRAWLLEFIINFEDADEHLVEVQRGYLNDTTSYDDLDYTPSFKESLAKYDSVKLRLLIKEILLCNRLLDSDDRNFHCWRHRVFALCCLRYVSVNLSWDSFIDEMHHQELRFIDRMIQANFSNYSAWHYRTLLSNMPQFKLLENYKKESELVKTAIFTEPNDQSIWQYYLWLIGEFLPGLMFKDCQLEMETSFYVSDIYIRLPEVTRKEDRTEIRLKFSTPCYINSEESSITVEHEGYPSFTLEEGIWEPMYEENSARSGFVNTRLPKEFEDKYKKRTTCWKFVFLRKERPVEEFDMISEMLRKPSSLLIRIMAINSNITYSRIPVWSLDDRGYQSETFSSLQINPMVLMDNYKPYRFIASTDGDQVSCKYLFDSELEKSQLKSFMEYIRNELEMVKSIFELEPTCKYPIIAIKLVYDTFQRCSPDEVVNYGKCVDIELIKQLPLLDPLRRFYYSDKFKDSERM
ncbi:Rab geranylgeranyltransferase alpha subunit [Cryptosporidium canis]|uniref:Geranylgeranyl transferase type-2 subunit alpha n=1 Tax=Cryptosporidium canis TaxID=195482 RepID=A0A9D5DI42_9CRYT|nr:Rab geranylgeranyltransferase alpha subunit [Cryptosporidium canis]